VDDDTLRQIWNERGRRLQTLLEAHGAADLDFRVDLGKGRLWWQHDDTPVVVASARLLLSYALSNRSVLMGWANRSLPPDASVSPVAGAPERIPECNEADAWTWARRVAEASGAHFIYRAPNQQSWVFLGLWDVRKAAEGDAPFVAVSPWGRVVSVLEGLAEALAEGRDIRVLAHGYGRTFVEDRTRHGTPEGERLRIIGERLAALAKRESPDIRPDLDALLDEARALLAQAAATSPKPRR
jgi:nucleotide-binding universal stress UspA family protein